MMEFRGSGVALVTPFKENLEVDFQGLENLVNHCINGGINYLVVMGTTAENATLNKEEKVAVLNHIKKVNGRRLPIVFGIGGNNTQELVNTINETDFDGVNAILSVSPYYNKPTQEGIYQHFKTISINSPVPIILYNVPGRTASNMTADTTLRLANDFENIIGIKEASGNMEQVMKIIKERPKGFKVISGDDNLSLSMICCGGDGVISVSGQGFPKVFTKMVNSALSHMLNDAREAHYKLLDITNMLFEEGNPGGIKAVLEEKGICGSTLRQPLWKISENLKNRIQKEMAKESI